jgi:hypothetical protein
MNAFTAASGKPSGNPERDEAVKRFAAHRRDVAQVHRKRLVSQIGIIDLSADEMHALDERVGGHQEVVVYDRGVVAYTHDGSARL